MVDFHGDKSDFRRFIRGVVDQLTGKASDQDGSAKSVFYAIGLQLLSDVQEAFIVKSRGGTGEDGVTWPPLSKEYLAYHRRFGPGEKTALKSAAGLGRANSRGIAGKQGLLTAAQQKRWWEVYSQTLAWAIDKHGEGAKAIAAGRAWNVVKSEGAKTMLEVYGNRQVDILRDTGVLFNSLSPGYLAGPNYTKPSGEGGDKQIFDAINNGIVVGTNVFYAGSHNKGNRVPKRQIFPDRIPAMWASRLVEVGVQAIQSVVTYKIRGAA